MPNSVWFSCSVFYNTHTKCTIASSLKQDLVQVGVELPLRKSIRHLFADWMDKGAKPLARLALKLQEVRGDALRLVPFPSLAFSSGFLASDGRFIGPCPPAPKLTFSSCHW